VRCRAYSLEGADDGRLLVIMTGTGEVAAEHVLVPARRGAVPRWALGRAAAGGAAQNDGGEGVLRARFGR
jgi:hypothetical protein